MQKIKQLTLSIMLMFGLVAGFNLATSSVYAQTPPSGGAAGSDAAAGGAAMGDAAADAAGGSSGVNAGDEACKGITEAFGGECNAGGGGDEEQAKVGGLFGQVVNIMSWIIGIISVIVLIMGGLRYIISGGDSAGINSAKNTILYALVGLGIVLFAQIIVKFVIGKISPGL